VITFREMRIADLESVIRIEYQVFENPWPIEAFTEDIVHDAFVLTDHDVVFAYIFCMVVLDECSIMNIAVAPDHQRRGFGEILFKNITSILALREVNVYFLDVRQSNKAAQNLYNKLGFRAIAIRKGYYNHPDEDAIVMTLLISEAAGSYEKL